MNVLAAIVESLHWAANYNSHELAAPTVVLWPDEERLWTQAIPALRASYPLLWTLGDYDPGNGIGPAVWIRHQLETEKGGDVPVVYLPGIARSAFRSADQCPAALTHLFALQFQGQFWTQKNGKDWTPFAFLSSGNTGLSLDVAADQETKKAIQECLQALLKVEVSSLKTGKLEAADFRELVTPDPARTLLRWMSDPVRIQQEMMNAGSGWTTFCAVCRKTYHFDPEKDGAITAAEKLTSGKGAWPTVWQRYKDSYPHFPGVKPLLESLAPTRLFAEKASEYKPLSNRREEELLAKELLQLESLPHKDALAKIKALAAEHGPRAKWVWAAMGESPLAMAMENLATLVATVDSTGTPATWDALAEYYSSTGWKADWSVLRGLDTVRSTAPAKALAVAIRAVYIPWLEKLAVTAQAQASNYPSHGPQACRCLTVEDGTVYLFADGLRMDIARGLEASLLKTGAPVEIALDHNWAALPTVTATAKSAWMPLAARLGGPLEGTGFQAVEQNNGKALTHSRFKQLLEELGISFLESGDAGSPTGCAWTEMGSVDSYGHEQGAKLAWRIDEEITGLRQRILDLLNAGWAKVVVTTDHGWLMVPGGLPKAELPKHLTATRWSRCALPGEGAQHGYPLTSWFWDAAESVVLAPGISCFSAGMEYSHGGLTIQESLIPLLTVSARTTGVAKTVNLKSWKWAGLRLNMVFTGAQGLTVDLRSKVADPDSSFAKSPATVSADGEKTSILVAEDDTIGTAAFLVVVDKAGQVIFKQPIVIGEN